MLKIIVELDDHLSSIDKSVLLEIKNELTPIVGSDQVRVFVKNAMYTFQYDITIDINFDMEDVASVFYDLITQDFVLEIDAEEMSFDVDDDCGEDELTMPCAHSEWCQNQIQNGWRYGVDYLLDEKTNPYLVPYHRLSKRQKGRVGYYGGLYGMIGHDHPEDISFDGDYGSGDSGE